MKRLATIVAACALSGCVGFSFVSKNEGLYLEHSENKSKRNDYRLPDYSTEDDSDPGNRVVLTSGIEISTNCFSEKLLSFMPSIVVPLPPVIPWFSKDPKWPDELLVFVKGKTRIEEVILESNGRQRRPIELKPGVYRFDISCASLRGYPATLQFTHGGRTEPVRLIYRKVHNFGWVWIGGGP